MDNYTKFQVGIPARLPLGSLMVLFVLWAVGMTFAEPLIKSIEPLSLVIGVTNEVTIIGERFNEAKGAPPGVWSNFPANWERVEQENGKIHARELRCRVVISPDAQPGIGAVRVWTRSGVSLPQLLLVDREAATVSFSLTRDKPNEHAFEAKAGQNVFCETWSNRLNQDADLVMSVYDPSGREIATADDDEVVGSDAVLQFTAESDGTHTARVHDIRWRAGPQCALRIGGAPLLSTRKPDQARKTANQPDPITFPLKAGQFLTITPRTRMIGSPAMLVLDLLEPGGASIARTGTGDQLDEIIRRKIEKPGDYRLLVRDLLGRENLWFDMDISTDLAPFDLQVDGKIEWFALMPGQEITKKFKVRRFHFDGPITVECPELIMTNNVIAEKQGEVTATLKVPDDAEPNRLRTLHFRATAELEGQRFSAPLSTLPQLKRKPVHLLSWPEGVDRVAYAVVGQRKEEKTEETKEVKK